MLDGVADQLHQFITTRTSSFPVHLSFPLNNASLTSDTFDPYHHLPLQQPNQQGERQLTEFIDSCWTHDEVLALFRIRSTLETCFPSLTWEHVSRKLAELGFKRSAEKCKHKFEEETRYLNPIHYTDHYRFISDLEQELYQAEGDHRQADVRMTEEKSRQHQLEKPKEGQDKTSGHALQHDDTSGPPPSMTKRCAVGKSKDRKRKNKPDGEFEMLKGFCENIFNRMMSQQEDMHLKLLQDMLTRDEERLAREQAWKKQELDKMNKELDIMAHEQALAGNRHATVIEFLQKFTAGSPKVTNASDSQNLHFSVEN